MSPGPRPSPLDPPPSLLAACLLALLVGCAFSTPDELTVYSALDREFAEPILKDFEAETGIRVLAVYDAESTKTVGLVNRIIAEQARPRCDLFWNNEILNTRRLVEQKLVAPYVSPAAADFPAEFKDPAGLWHGFAARARILIVNTNQLPNEAAWPKSVTELADPKWQGRAGLAKPLFGTTATHAACLFALWGDDRAKEFFRAARANAKVFGGNKQVALAVASGEIAWGLTDTDDALGELEKGLSVAIVYPDADGDGTLFIPNSLALIAGGPRPDLAKKLVDYLLSPPVETKLAAGASGQIPLNPKVTAVVRVKTPATTKAMAIDFATAAAKWDAAAKFLTAEFARSE